MLFSSTKPHEPKFQVSLLSPGRGGWGKMKLKLTQPPARVGLSLAKISKIVQNVNSCAKIDKVV